MTLTSAWLIDRDSDVSLFWWPWPWRLWGAQKTLLLTWGSGVVLTLVMIVITACTKSAEVWQTECVRVTVCSKHFYPECGFQGLFSFWKSRLLDAANDSEMSHFCLNPLTAASVRSFCKKVVFTIICFQISLEQSCVQSLSKSCSS